MARNGAATNGDPTNEQAEYVQRIDTIVVDPDDVIEHFEKNVRNSGTLYDPRKFKVSGVRSGGECGVSVGVDPRDEGGYYPDTPHPVWIPPSKFVEGATPTEPDTGATKMPTRAESKQVARDEFEGDEDSDEFEEFVDEVHEMGLEEWRSAVRHNLKDQLTFEFRAVEHVPEFQEETITHTVEVRYESDD